MVFISMDLKKPQDVFSLTHSITFTKIKVVEFVIQINNISIAGVDSILLCINDFNDNHHIFDNISGSGLNTQYLCDIPYVVGQPISYSPVNMYPPDYHNPSTKSERYFRLKLKKPDGQTLTTGEYGATSAHVVLFLE